MKIITWNINGIRACVKKPYFFDLINNQDPDIFCLGEIKITYPSEIQTLIKNNIKYEYYDYWSHSTARLGYSGTVIYSKKKPINVIIGLNINNVEYDDEGRVITCEFNKFYLIHVYTPNSGMLLKRLDFRVKIWDIKFKEYILKLQEHKPVIICGDLNVAHTEIDLKNPKTNLKTAGFTIQERESFDSILNDIKLTDTYRFLHPTDIKYSYWSYRNNSRNKNIGWRIDYFLIDNKLIKKLIKSDILTDVLGSDHAPIILEIKLN